MSSFACYILQKGDRIDRRQNRNKQRIECIRECASSKDGLCGTDTSNAEHEIVEEGANHDGEGGRERKTLGVGRREMMNAVGKEVDPVGPAGAAVHVEEEAMQAILDDRPEEHAHWKHRDRESKR